MCIHGYYTSRRSLVGRGLQGSGTDQPGSEGITAWVQTSKALEGQAEMDLDID